MSHNLAPAQQQQMGYPVGNLRDLDPRFKCAHCQLLLRDPMQGDCGHRYCRGCVLTKFNEARKLGQESLCDACDATERAEISPDRTYPDIAVKREIGKNLKVHCPNSPCHRRDLRLQDLDEHLPNCDFQPQLCDLCGEQVAAAKMPDHRTSACRRRPVPCDACKGPVPFEAMDSHKAGACIGSAIQCEFCLARVKDDEQAKDRHRRAECPAGWHEVNPCPFGCTEMPEGWQEHRLKCQATHLDRLLARSAQLPPAADSEPPRSRPSDAQGRAPPVLTDYEELNSLKERARGMERKLTEMLPLPASVLAGVAAADSQVALVQGEKLDQLLGVIKEQFDSCYDKIRQYELRMQKDFERKLDIERKHQDLVKLLAYKEMKLLDLERRLEIQEHGGCDGVLVWKITDVRRRKEAAREGKVCSVYSPPFYTGKAGYKMCGRLYLNGDGAGKNTHISLFFVIMRGAYDALLPWPFSKKVTMMLLDQNFDEHAIDAFKPDTLSSSFKRPSTDMNIASGCPLFMPLGDFENGSRGFVKDDTMFIKFIVDTSDLPI